MTSIASRINRIATAFPLPRCNFCGTAHTRLVFIDGRTDEVESESVPETGCPECGHQPYREIHVVSDEGWDDPLSLV